MQFHRATVSGVITGNPACDQNAWQKMVADADSKTWIVHFWPYFSAVKQHWCWPVFEHVRKAQPVIYSVKNSGECYGCYSGFGAPGSISQV